MSAWTGRHGEPAWSNKARCKDMQTIWRSRKYSVLDGHICFFSRSIVDSTIRKICSASKFAVKIMLYNRLNLQQLVILLKLLLLFVIYKKCILFSHQLTTIKINKNKKYDKIKCVRIVIWIIINERGEQYGKLTYKKKIWEQHSMALAWSRRLLAWLLRCARSLRNISAAADRKGSSSYWYVSACPAIACLTRAANYKFIIVIFFILLVDNY